MSPRHQKSLQGRRILIVEDEPFIAFDLADAVEGAGGEVVGPAMSISEARRLLQEAPVEAAILDVDLPDGTIEPVVAELVARQVALVIHTGAGLTPQLAATYPQLDVFSKPTAVTTLTEVLAWRLGA